MKQQWQELTIEQAKKSPLKHRYGAILVHKGKLISTGYNRDLFRFGRHKPLGLCS
jgi:deoxycytidylate deaminase